MLVQGLAAYWFGGCREVVAYFLRERSKVRERGQFMSSRRSCFVVLTVASDGRKLVFPFLRTNKDESCVIKLFLCVP